MKIKTGRSLLTLFLLLLIGILAFCALFRWDNKYTAALPGGPGYNVMLDPERVSFLVDGWEYYPGQLLSPEEVREKGSADSYTYAGEHSNFSAQLDSPYGTATYRLVLENSGDPVELALYLPELLCAGRIYINGRLVGEHGSLVPYVPRVMDGVYAFTASGNSEIVIQCSNYTHYYSGMYYPPAIGTLSAVSRMISARLTVYGLLCFAALAVALSNLAMWMLGHDKMARYMGLLCLSFALRISYPFIRALGVPVIRPLYAMEDFFGNTVLLCAILLAGELSGYASRRFHRRLVIPTTVSLCIMTVIFPIFILPYAHFFVNIYGFILFLWKLIIGIYLIFLSVQKIRTKNILGRYLICAAGLYGLSVMFSVLTVGYFEPIRGAWPEEYGGFALVAGFAALMVHRGVLLTEENSRLTLHLREEVDRKTQALETLLSERRELLSHLLHDLKNPLAAVRSYADLVHSGGVALDRETTEYLEALTDRVGAVEKRFDQLQSFSRGERGLLDKKEICLNQFLRRFYESNRPDMELSGQTFQLDMTSEELRVFGDEDRLRTALENLCYNALSFTPEDGTITIALEQEGDLAVISVKDTGIGILPEDLPNVFEYGFTHREDGSGEGLGLFIVRTVALEHGGTVEAMALPGKGSVFTLRLPIIAE